MRIAVVLSRDPKHADYMWSHRLDATLQYLVKTDFSLFRRKTTTTQGSQKEEKKKLDMLKESGVGKTKRKSILDSGERTPSTLMFLALVKPQKAAKKSAARSEEINYFCTRYVVILYENIINVKMEVVHDLVSSGVIGALLFRVGRGQDRSPRFNKLVAHFLHQMLQKVMLYQDHKGYHMALQVGVKNTKLSFHLPRGDDCPPPSAAFLAEKRALIDKASAPSDTVDSRPITPMVPSTAPLSRVGTAPQVSGIKNATGRSSRKMSVLDEALADQARERLETMRVDNESVASGQWRDSPLLQAGGSGETDFQSVALAVDTSTTYTKDGAAEPAEGGIGSPKHHPGFTPGPGFRKRLANKDAEFNFPTDEDGVPIHPPASPISPINRRHKGAGHGGSESPPGSAAATESVGFGDGMDLADGSEASDTMGDGLGGLTLSMAGSVVPFEGSGVPVEGGRSQSTAATGMDSEKVKEIYRRKLLQQSTDLRSISNTLTAQGVVENFFATLETREGEDPEVVKESLLGLAIMDFSTYYEIATEKRALTALFQIYRTRHDLYFPFLHILCEMIQSFEVPESALKSLIVEQQCIPILLSAMNLSGWHFHRKNTVYRCFGKFTAAGFGQQMYEEVSDSGGISVLCREVQIRKKRMRKGKKGEDEDGDGTEMLLPLLRRDIASIKIQAQARRRRAAKRMAKVRAEHDEWMSFLAGEKAKKAKDRGSPSRKKR
jgi:hypothetical protein